MLHLLPVLLLLLSSAALAEDNFVVDGHQPPPEGTVFALRGEHMELIRTEPHTTYWATVELFSGSEKVGAVLGTFDAGNSMFLPPSPLTAEAEADHEDEGWPNETRLMRVNQHAEHDSEVTLLLGVAGSPLPSRVSPEQAALLQSGQRFSFGAVELQIHARGYDSVRVRLNSATTLPPVLEPPSATDLRRLPRVSHQPKRLMEDHGWFMASLPVEPQS